jgi:UDP-N-acetylmuramoyl-L-alanyl-D-glutamate--2,6-diaminopimelate ligase
MTLKTLVEGISEKASGEDLGVEIAGISTDSRRVRPGDLFVALRGGHEDGRKFIPEAVSRGAAAVLYEGDGPPAPEGVPSVLVEDARDALAEIACRFHGRPSEGLALTGITGTNGKTSTAYILRSVLQAAGLRTGLIGTISYAVGEKTKAADFTTPEPQDFQGLLREMLEAGLSHVVAEVSSHALALRRVDYTRFSVAVFTNLTRDHLDFHRGMEDYFESKKRLFTELIDADGTAVVNLDDPYGKKLKSAIRGRTLTYGFDAGADLLGEDLSVGPEGIRLNISYGGESRAVESGLLGTPNAQNILAAAGAALALGVSWEAIAAGVGNLRSVEGRFDRVELGQDFLLIVDYAHTDDALRGLLRSAREITRGRVITVFGCGGERDRGKRPLMGAAASELSDLVFVTSDNPRGEDPMAIIRDIEAGIERRNYRVVPSRAEAIAEAVEAAGASDTVLIAGKGHEDYQLVRGERLSFSDRKIAEAAVRRKMRG